MPEGSFHTQWDSRKRYCFVVIVPKEEKSKQSQFISTMPPNAEDDEALARALQEQYRMDYERSVRASQRLQPSPSAPPEETSSPAAPHVASRIDDVELARRLEQERRDAELARRLSVMDNSNHVHRETYSAGVPVADAVAVQEPTRRSGHRSSERRPSSRSRHRSARVMQGEESTGYNSSRNLSGPLASDGSRLTSGTTPNSTSLPHNAQSSRTRSSRSVSAVQPSISRGTPVSPSPVVAATSPTMMEQYTAVEPDAVDVELALILQQEERDAAIAVEMTRADQEAASRRVSLREARRVERENPTRRCTCKRVLAMACPCIIIAVAVLAVIMVVASQGNVGNVPNLFDDDPFNAGKASRWKRNGNGLDLEVVSALEESWFDSFDLAVSDWDGGDPDALTLSRSFVEYDYDCEPIRGKLKVCNGDYGSTRWKGINQILLSSNWIISSVAKLNDKYLSAGGADQQRYTMCHEIGHGFGLPHTDEDFYNQDLGNCMDYTNNPTVNMRPDTSNYELLRDLYGNVSGRLLVQSDERLDGNVTSTLGTRPHDTGLPKHLLELYNDAVKELESNEAERWTVLHKSKFASHLAVDLGHNYTLVVSMLLATE